MHTVVMDVRHHGIVVNTDTDRVLAQITRLLSIHTLLAILLA